MKKGGVKTDTRKSYSLYVMCNECSGVHPMGFTVKLDDGPASRCEGPASGMEGPDDAERHSLRDVYAGKELPPEVARLINNTILCPVTHGFTRQKDNDQVFLVRTKT